MGFHPLNGLGIAELQNSLDDKRAETSPIQPIKANVPEVSAEKGWEPAPVSFHQNCFRRTCSSAASSSKRFAHELM